MPTKNIVDIMAGWEAYQEKRAKGRAANKKYYHSRRADALNADTGARK